MSNKQKIIFIIGGILLFILYIFGAARPIPEEIVLESRWIKSLPSTYEAEGDDAVLKDAEQGRLLPFQLGDRFGYTDKDGNFTVNRTTNGFVSLSGDYWADYAPVPQSVDVRDPAGGLVLSLDFTPGGVPAGYPFFLDKRIFLINSEQTSISAITEDGSPLWTYDFASVITCVDAANGLLLIGSLDGAVEVLNSTGKRVFFFEPGGSRLSVILGCAFSRDGSQFAVVSGIDEQRFLHMERLGGSADNSYRVSYHEFLGRGFRSPVRVDFVDNDGRVVFERESGLGLYETASRISLTVPLDGEIAAIDGEGSDGLLFLLLDKGDNLKELAAVQFPASLMLKAPFTSRDVFLGRQDNILYIGGGSMLAALEIVKR